MSSIAISALDSGLDIEGNIQHKPMAHVGGDWGGCIACFHYKIMNYN